MQLLQGQRVSKLGGGSMQVGFERHEYESKEGPSSRSRTSWRGSVVVQEATIECHLVSLRLVPTTLRLPEMR